MNQFAMSIIEVILKNFNCRSYKSLLTIDFCKRVGQGGGYGQENEHMDRADVTNGVNAARVQKWTAPGSEFSAKKYSKVLADYARQ